MFSKTLFRIFYTVLMVLSVSACSAYKGLPYLKYQEVAVPEKISYDLNVYEPCIMPNDIISITVNSNIRGAAADFNLPLVPNNYNKPDQTVVTGTAGTSGTLQTYLVDKNGNIDFPVLGKVQLGGLTIEDAKAKIESLIHPEYILEKPIINIRFANYRISVLGEVMHPGIYTSENGQMTIFDALAAAGDLTIYGRRDNVLLIRLGNNGQIETFRINLQSKELVSDKDIFYLKQNDKIYVEPNKTKGNNSRFGTLESISLSAVSIIISVIAIITR